MKLAAFHLMPWPHLPENFSEVEDSAWITYSNENFRPEIGTALYNRYLDELAYCEEAGFDVVAVNEHHQTAYGLMPSPNLMAMSLVERTKHVQIAILGNAIPLRDHPMRVAEELGILDVISGGRIICGLVRGLGAEYHSFSMSPVHSQERFIEAHDLLIKAWTDRGPFEWDGKHYKVKYVNPWPRPLQSPHPPVWVPTQGSSSTVRWVAEKGYTLFQTFSPIDTVAKSTRQFRDYTRELGYSASPEKVGWSVPIYVGRDDETALAEFKPHIEYLYHQLRRRPWQATVAAGYVPRESAKYVMKRREGIGSDQPTAEELLARGEIIVGGPQTVNRLLRESIQKAGIGTLAMMIQSGTMGAELTRASIDRLAEHVLPGLKDYLPDLPDDLDAAQEVVDPVTRTV